MKKITVLLLSIGIILFTYSCKSDSNNENDQKNENTEVVDQNTEKDENVAADDFDAFWKEFQAAVANKDNDKLKELASQNTFDMMGDDFIIYFDDEFYERVANASSADIETIDNNTKRFFYVVQYPTDGEDDEVFESSFGFDFVKENGKWKISTPLFAG
ncbi:MAG: hypothetical protein JXL97_07580 [Bacteroidales bacterium]|nr:hypothetical protein [Bacteroidales bacterium]